MQFAKGFIRSYRKNINKNMLEKRWMRGGEKQYSFVFLSKIFVL